MLLDGLIARTPPLRQGIWQSFKIKIDSLFLIIQNKETFLKLTDSFDQKSI